MVRAVSPVLSRSGQVMRFYGHPVACRTGIYFCARRCSPEAVWIVNLPDRASYLPALRLVAYWKQRGAVCLIARTRNAVGGVTPHQKRLLSHADRTNQPAENTIPGQP